MPFTIATIVLNLAAAVFYVRSGDYARATYWTAAAVLGIATLKMR